VPQLVAQIGVRHEIGKDKKGRFNRPISAVHVGRSYAGNRRLGDQAGSAGFLHDLSRRGKTSQGAGPSS